VSGTFHLTVAEDSRSGVLSSFRKRPKLNLESDKRNIHSPRHFKRYLIAPAYIKQILSTATLNPRSMGPEKLLLQVLLKD
jgi:hypothetical protein